MKAVINKCYGGFSLSEEAYKFMGIEWDEYGYAYSDRDNKEKRTDAKLIECVETLGERADGNCADLYVVEFELFDGAEWLITEYDGMEQVITFKPSKSLSQVLDEIRVEIEQLRIHKAQFVTNDNKICIDSQAVLNIINKYIKESEE